MHRARTAVIAAASLVVAGLGALTMSAQAGTHTATASAQSLKVIQWNVGEGAECTAVDRSTCLDLLRTQVQAVEPDVVTLEEVCKSELAEVRSIVGHATFTPLTENNKSCHGGSAVNGLKGQIVASPHVLSHVSETNLMGGYTTDSGLRKQFTLLCADVATGWTRTVHGCTVHLRSKKGKTAHPADTKWRTRQVKHIVMATDGWRAEGDRVVVGGDFNFNDLGNGAAGVAPMKDGYQELQGNHPSPTHGSGRLDYIWVSRGGITNTTGTVLGTGTSDHHMVKGEVTYSS